VSGIEFDGGRDHITPGQPKLAGLHLRLQGPPDRDDHRADRTAQHACLDVTIAFWSCLLLPAVCCAHRTRREKQDEHRSEVPEGAVVLISVDILHDKKEEHMM